MTARFISVIPLGYAVGDARLCQHSDHLLLKSSVFLTRLIKLHSQYSHIQAWSLNTHTILLKRKKRSPLNVGYFSSFVEQGTKCSYRYVTWSGRNCRLKIKNKIHFATDTSNTGELILRASCTCLSGTTLFSRTPFPLRSCDLEAGIGWSEPWMHPFSSALWDYG